MAGDSVMSSYWRGLRDGLPFLIVVGPFGMLFGVLATEAGLAIHETLAFSVVVIAGAAQFTALQLLTENAPTLVVIASALAVNMRMAMYSASITPHLGGLPWGYDPDLPALVLCHAIGCVVGGKHPAQPRARLCVAHCLYRHDRPALAHAGSPNCGPHSRGSGALLCLGAV